MLFYFFYNLFSITITILNSRFLLFSTTFFATTAFSTTTNSTRPTTTTSP